MIRPFTESDVSSYPQIKILSHTRADQSQKDYLLIERPPFIAALITINDRYTIFVEQFRPIISKSTLEIPMGKMEKFEQDPLETLKRELKEESCLDLDAKTLDVLYYGEKKSLPLQHIHITAQAPNYLSPGFSTSLQYPFFVHIEIEKSELAQFDNYQAISQEEHLLVYFFELKKELCSQVEGLSRYMLYQYFFEKLDKN